MIENAVRARQRAMAITNRSLKTVGMLDHKIKNLREKMSKLANRITESISKEQAERLEQELDQYYKQMKALTVEKYDLAESAFLYYENGLREVDKTLDDFKPPNGTPSEITLGEIRELERTTKARRDRSKKSKKKAGTKKRDKKEVVKISLEQKQESPKVVPDLQGGLTKETLEPAPSSYCLCKTDRVDNMIACDNPECKVEWYHFGCVGLTHLPDEHHKWYCPDCTSKAGVSQPSGKLVEK